MHLKSNKPYIVVGADRLTASVYKADCEQAVRIYSFNVAALDDETGEVKHWYHATDLLAFLKLVRVLSFELYHDGCLDRRLRLQLREIANALDCVLSQIPKANNKGETEA